MKPQGTSGEIKGMFEGPILPVTIRIGVPILIGNILHFAYSLVDTWFLSSIDKSSTAIMSGTGLVFPLFFLFMAVGMSMSVGLSSLVGRAIGERNRDILDNVMPAGCALIALIGLPALVAGYLMGPWLVNILAGERMSPQALAYGLSYFRWLLPGLTLMLAGQVFMGILGGQGRTGIIAQAMGISTVLNMVLDPLLIFVFDMGVGGAGLATTIAMLVAALYVAFAFVKEPSTVPFACNPLRAHRRILVEVLRVGFPHFLSMASLAFSFMFLNKLVGSISQGAMNAWILVGRFNDAVLIPSFAVANASMTMIAQNFGRRQADRVRSIYLANCLLAMGVVAAVSLVYMGVAPLLFGLMSSVPEVVTAAVGQVRLLSLTFVGVAAAIVSASTFQAVGKPLPATGLAIIRMGVIAVPLAWILVRWFGLGMHGVFWGVGISYAVALPLSMGVCWAFLRRLDFSEAAPVPVPELNPVTAFD